MSDEFILFENFGPFQFKRYRPWAIDKDGHWIIHVDLASKKPDLYSVGLAREALVLDGDMPKMTDFNGAGFHFRLERYTGPGMRGGMTYSCTLVPLPALVFVAGVYPVVFCWSWRRRTRKARHQQIAPCCNCGYSLVGNVSGICPECGTTVA